ncbi:uncharacterized protein LOC126847091 isoform X3 [Adelges cooleyi]|uniref:uncharacterized protein LOC126847091 isoform X3 n=1 Tax=Adelges cooleyi TaxID=133065 RepID=UPI0021808CED|nr:uncharacterized protein LOC126847091 isoform X3 [Adelges cooleyi]
MEAVQQTVIHLDRPAMPSQAQMAYPQRNPQIHGNVNHGVVQVSGENSPYKTSSAGTGPVHNNFVGYPANIRYVSQPVYMSATTTASNAYRDAPYHSRALNISDRGVALGVPFELARSDMMPPVARQNRISLLSATSDYYQRSRMQLEHYRDESLNHNSHNTVSMNFMRERPDHGPPPPLKKPKLLHPISPQPPLKIDISDPPSTSAYNPQVEAISPTVDEPMPEYKKLSDIAPKLNKIESDISTITQEIEDLIKLKENYEQKELNSEVTKIEPKEEADKECEEEDPMKHLTPVQKIYASNRKKAYESRTSLEKFANKTDLPLYNQPSDADVYHENRRKYAVFKSRLLEHLRKKKMEQQQTKTEITETYSKLYKEWIRRVEKVESSQKRKAKEAKHRELFEKVFPELRKQREDKERFNRVGARIKSEADLEEIMDGLQEQEMEDKKMRSYAVIPPLMLDPHERHLTYLNNNGLVLDYKTEYNETKYINIWTQQEKDVFKDRFIAHPKNFGAIASYLDKKCPADCVKYYYLSKPKEEYKRLLRKAKWQARRRTAQNRTPASSSLNSLDILNSTSIGVTTRLQRERQGSEAASSSIAHVSVAHNPLPDNEETPAPTETPNTIEQDMNDVTECQTGNLPTNKSETNECVSNLVKSPVPSHTSEMKSESKKKERRKDDKQKGENTSTTDEELMDSRHEGGTKGDVPKGICAVCKAENVACPRTLNPSDAAQYGVKPEDIKPGARVCNTCRCKVVRSQNRRVIYCPLPSCPTVQSNSRRPVKRLRPLPAKWTTAQDIIASEFQISPTTTKCCSACFNRIQRRLMALGVVGTTNNMSTDSLDGWTDEETNALKKGIREHGTRWSEISKLVGPNKSHYQCKEFYFSFRKKLGLDLLVQEYKKTNGSEQKPALTDEEESGSSTSSCDETNLVLCDSDTQSAPSPTNTLPRSSPSRETISPSQAKLTIVKESRVDSEGTSRSVVIKEDYDSSATETADEGTGGTAENESNVMQHSINESDKKDKNLTDLSVSDILCDVIEKQFTKEHVSNREKENGSMPTISSILLDPEYPIKDRISGSNNEMKQSMATISVVPPREHHHNKDGLVVVQVQSSKVSDVRVSEGVTLDLSIKRPREGDAYADPPPIKHAQPPPPPGAMYRPPPTQIHETSSFYSPQFAELGRCGKQGEIYWTKLSPANNHVMVHPSQSIPHVTVKQTSHIKLPNKVTSPQLTVANVVSSKLSPNMLNNSKATGSIMHGTPVSAATLYMPSQSNRYSQPSQASGGSITQGTPVHQRMLHNSQNINPDYYQKRNPQPQYQSRQPHFSEQRQIIMNDYITSQQMHSNVAAQFPRAQKPPPVTSPMYYQPTRQGVIQRHNTAPKVTSPQSYPPGHEALGSLVDVAIRQPSLPVPLTHPDDRHREQERFVRGSPVPKIYREQQRQELIQREREMVVQREREMQAVAQIREQQQREQYMRDKQMMQHRLTPEQHSRMVVSFQQQQRQQEQSRGMQIPSTASSFQQSRSNTPVSRHQEPPSNMQSRDSGAGGRLSRQGMEHALTAANLIDAIITHQINQSNDGSGHPPNSTPATSQVHVQQQRAGDKLFQAFPEANEKPAVKPRGSPDIVGRPGEQLYSAEHSFKEYPGSYMVAATAYEPHTWKLRRALQQKECEQQMKDDNNRVRFYPTQADIPLSPLDYVKNRIVEVMRTSDDDNKTEQAYTYPFSTAINMSTSAVQKNNETSDTNIGGSGGSGGGGGGSGGGNGAPTLTAQYEPMSDED